MANNFPELLESSIEALSRVLGDCGTGTDITRILRECELVDQSGESTKWRRLYSIFTDSQKKGQSSNHIFSFIEKILAPVRFSRRKTEFEEHRHNLNLILIMHGIEFGRDGKYRFVDTAHTLDEAERRIKTIRDKLKGRAIHHEVNKYCKKELMQENYFHAVFEASKGLAQRIRELTGEKGDGAKLIDKVFALDNPKLAINSLQTDTEQSEHKGFAQLLRGCFAAIRNPLAHEPKILWTGEDDAADYFSLISLMHRKLDMAVKTNPSIMKGKK